MATGVREIPTDKVDLWADARSQLNVEHPYWSVVSDALEALTPREAYILTSKAIEKLTWVEMGHRFGLSPTTVQRHYDRAVEKMADALNVTPD